MIAKKWYHNVVFISIPLVTNEVEHLFIYFACLFLCIVYKFCPFFSWVLIIFLKLHSIPLSGYMYFSYLVSCWWKLDSFLYFAVKNNAAMNDLWKLRFTHVQLYL